MLDLAKDQLAKRKQDEESNKEVTHIFDEVKIILHLSYFNFSICKMARCIKMTLQMVNYPSQEQRLKWSQFFTQGRLRINTNLPLQIDL